MATALEHNTLAMDLRKKSYQISCSWLEIEYVHLCLNIKNVYLHSFKASNPVYKRKVPNSVALYLENSFKPLG